MEFNRISKLQGSRLFSSGSVYDNLIWKKIQGNRRRDGHGGVGAVVGGRPTAIGAGEGRAGNATTRRECRTPGS